MKMGDKSLRERLSRRREVDGEDGPGGIRTHDCRIVNQDMVDRGSLQAVPCSLKAGPSSSPRQPSGWPTPIPVGPYATRSTTAAMPCPPPMHIVSSPNWAFRRSIS
jgi:hypothetical protein